MKAWPMPRVRMKVSLPRDTFLSWAIDRHQPRRRQADRAGISAIRQGSPTARRCVSTRAASSGLARLSREEKRCASAMPMATPSPWTRRVPSYCVAASSAWPNVWPRLSSARSPVSNSSRATTSALARQASAMASPLSGPPAKTFSQFASSQAKKSGPVDQPVFGEFGIAGAEFADRQRVEHLRVGQHQLGLQEDADEVLAARAC